MAFVANRANPLLNSLPHFLTWPSLGFRTICSGRMGFSSLSSHNLRPDPEQPDAKVLETFTEEFEIGSRLITLETGKMARFANGAVVLGMDGTKVLSTVCSAKGNAVKDFLPLTVEYQEKQFAHGMIPNTFMKREGAPKERELLCGRIIDRPIRPLFPKGFYHEVQVTASVLSSDGKQDPDVMAANAASAALMLSDIPWGGPIGMIRIGRIEGRFIVNPTMDELSLSDLNLVYACTRDKTLMIDVQAREISEKDLEAGLRLAHPEAVKYLEPQLKLAAKAGKHKKEYKLSLMPERTLEKVTQLAEAPIEAVFTDPSYGKFERGEALENIMQDVKKALEEECDEESLRLLPKAVDTVRKKVVRRRIITEGSRLDGRGLDEVRPLYCEAGYLPMLHGSSLFSRGDTQVLCTVTLGAPDDAQHLESVVGPPRKRFMLHYSFPPFCINEVGKHGGLNRREVGHGTLAEKALLAVLPPEDEFPYTVRINSEVMASDGSTSMASVCGGSIALMDAGIPLRKHVAGVSVGLVSEVDQLTGTIKEYRILTDILGLEDHLGDMDFKIVGTQDGITAIQLDIKPAGIPLDIVCESLEAARKGRIQILEHMEKEISAPRSQDDKSSPRLVTLKYSNDAIRSMIGPLGAVKRKIEDETGARICVSDGTLTIVAKNQSAMDKVLEKVDFILGREIEIGGIYKGTISSIKEYGAFVEFNGGQQGLLHISELSHEPVSRISDVVSVGQQISLMCIGQDVRGNLKFSLKATLPRPRSQTNNSVDKSVPSMKEGPKILAASERMSDRQEKQSSLSNEMPVRKYEVDRTNSSTSSPPVLIRSVAKCDGEEKSSVLVQNSKTTSEPIGIWKPDRKSFLDSLKSLQSHTLTSTDMKNREDPVTAKSLRIGTKVTGKVYQIRTGGLVLDLGGGIRGMYRFEANGTKDFEVNDELQVECVSFSSRGVPVMSLVNDGLSLSDTFPQSQNYNSLDKSVPSMKEGPNICATSGRLSEAQENQSSLSKELPVSKYEVDATNVAQDWPQGPSIANSDEEEKSTSLVQDCFQNTLKIWASSEPMSDEQDKQSSLSEEFPVRKYGVDKRSSSPSSLSDLIRNLAVKVEKSTCMVQNSKTTSEPIGGLESDRKSHRTTPKTSISFLECDKEGKSTGVLQESKTTSKPIGGLESDSKSQTTPEMSKSFSQKKGDKPDIASGTHTSNDLNNKGDPVTAKSLKLGSKVTGKVYQIPKGGWLVLDLGEGLRGTYRFKAKGKKDIQVNDELRVECVSFTSKGIPVMSVADDE